MANKANNLSQTKWLCDHIVLAPKYRRKIIYNQYKHSVWKILRKFCGYKGVEISVSQFIRYLKGKVNNDI